MEGLCGTGKTTAGRQIGRYLSGLGVSASFYDEGAANHPVSLNGHAFFRTPEYERLLERYPDESPAIEAPR